MNNKDYVISQLVEHFKSEGKLMLLESQMHGHTASNLTYFATEPNSWIKANGEVIEVWDGTNISVKKGNAWQELEAYKSSTKGWLFGYLGYDLKNSIEDLSSDNKSLIEAPDLFFFEPRILIEIDMDGNLRLIIGEVPSQLEAPNFYSFSLKQKKIISKRDYLHKIEQAQIDIEEGDYYEINISHPLEFEFEGEPWSLYQEMKRVGPVPFAGFLRLDSLAVCSSSPERFLSRIKNKVSSQPIKGTIQRNSENEQEAIDSLLNSEKERAENLMIVDLVRNDLNRIAKKGSVVVSNLFEVQSFRTVHQLVSTIDCEVEDSTSSVEIIKSCFPMGSMTGAPKIATMKTIERLEDYRRGIYSGAIGYFKPNGDFDLNVVIRSALIQNGKLIYPVGGAITSDSIPENEWEETFVKAKALTNTKVQE